MYTEMIRERELLTGNLSLQASWTNIIGTDGGLGLSSSYVAQPSFSEILISPGHHAGFPHDPNNLSLLLKNMSISLLWWASFRLDLRTIVPLVDLSEGGSSFVSPRFSLMMRSLLTTIGVAYALVLLWPSSKAVSSPLVRLFVFFSPPASTSSLRSPLVPCSSNYHQKYSCS